MSDPKKSNTVVIDIGKTHVKLHVLDNNFTSVFSSQMKNVVVASGDYPHVDIDGIWTWLTEHLKALKGRFVVNALTFTTHGATAALIDRNNPDSSKSLVMPILDYEFAGIAELNQDYNALRPSYATTFSPNLPVGLNLGRQLYWLQQSKPEDFANATDILMYPQYWVWRFTGQCYSEITSLGCHTDLWSIVENKYSSLVSHMQIGHLFPPMKSAWFDCGTILDDVAQQCELTPDCRIFNGIHDSNASYLRYKLALDNDPFTVISTGTWTVLMSSQGELTHLDERKDMLANIDAMGAPVTCARFMGGREFEAICELAGSWLGEQFGETDIQNVLDLAVFALPDFSHGSGPFGGNRGCFVGPVDKVSGIALATLYCALMIDYQLDMLGAEGKVFIEGAFLKNPLLSGILSQLRDKQEVLLSLDSTGTVYGAAQLTNWQNNQCEVITEEATTTHLHKLAHYRDCWREMAAQQ